MVHLRIIIRFVGVFPLRGMFDVADTKTGVQTGKDPRCLVINNITLLTTFNFS